MRKTYFRIMLVAIFILNIVACSDEDSLLPREDDCNQVFNDCPLTSGEPIPLADDPIVSGGTPPITVADAMSGTSDAMSFVWPSHIDVDIGTSGGDITPILEGYNGITGETLGIINDDAQFFMSVSAGEVSLASLERWSFSEPQFVDFSATFCGASPAYNYQILFQGDPKIDFGAQDIDGWATSDSDGCVRVAMTTQIGHEDTGMHDSQVRTQIMAYHRGSGRVYKTDQKSDPLTVALNFQTVPGTFGEHGWAGIEVPQDPRVGQTIRLRYYISPDIGGSLVAKYKGSNDSSGFIADVPLGTIVAGIDYQTGIIELTVQKAGQNFIDLQSEGSGGVNFFHNLTFEAR